MPACFTANADTNNSATCPRAVPLHYISTIFALPRLTCPHGTTTTARLREMLLNFTFRLNPMTLPLLIAANSCVVLRGKRPHDSLLPWCCIHEECCEFDQVSSNLGNKKPEKRQAGDKPNGFERLGLNDGLRRIVECHRGLVLVRPTGTYQLCRSTLHKLDVRHVVRTCVT